jgi:tetrapyrrole methylase family protein/MazG family protein/ATP diphosphatase
MSDIEKLLDIMVRLRDPHQGCPWDVEQTFASIAPYTIEEAYEVADAIARNDLENLKDELGDLLLQVVYHARIAEESGAFDFAAVVAAISDKMTRRHPHVFGAERIESAEAQILAWDALKDAEAVGQGRASVLDGLPVALPALSRATKLGRRAGRVGFDWRNLSGPRAKVDEELQELDEAIAQGSEDAISAEMGDVLFALANVCRHLKLDPETCLRGANLRFEERFRRVEEKVGAAGGDWQACGSDGLEEFWQEAKSELLEGDPV